MEDGIFLEYYITLNCNLNCISCSSFSPLVNENTHKDLNYIKKDFKKIYEITEKGKKIYKLVLMGGEPLYHPNIDNIINYFGELGINLRIVTNGILIPKMTESFFNMIKKYNIELIVSTYPSIKYKKIFKKLYINNIKHRLYDRISHFGHQYFHKEKKGITYCRYRNSVFILKDSKIYTCSETAHFDVFDKKFKGQHNLKVTKSDYVHLDEVETLEELIKLREERIPALCEYCDGSEKKMTVWDTSKGNLDEWLENGGLGK